MVVSAALSVVSDKAVIGRDVRIYDFVNIYGESHIGDRCVIGSFVEIQPGVHIGRKVKVSSHSFLCTGVTVEDEAFIGHGVMFTNDKQPASVTGDGTEISAATTNVVATTVKQRASIGSGSTILCGITIGKGALIGAGSVVTTDIPEFAVAYGNPAKVHRYINQS